MDEDLKMAYDLIENSRRKYGQLRKCEFHMHTPVSYDYKLLPDREYANISIEDMINIAIEENYIPTDIGNEMINSLEDYLNTQSQKKYKEKGFKDFKEYLAYLLIAHMLYKNDIEVVFIADHNTVNGFDKLVMALNDYYSERLKGTNRCSINVFLGVEISCSDKNHVVAICDKNRKEELKNYIGKILLSEKDGTYCDSRTVIEGVYGIGGIGYIAHLNTSEWLGSNAYKKKLFNSQYLKLIGLTNLEKKESVLNHIKTYNHKAEENIIFINEGDAHDIYSIGSKNTWVKFSATDFNSFKKAVKNGGICIYDALPKENDRYIKGIVVNPGDDGFLKGRKYDSVNKYSLIGCEPFSLCFSKDLNCIIGGRGTGKSTILNILETIYTLECDDRNILNFIVDNKIIYSTFTLDNSDYIIRFIPQVRDLTNSYYSYNVIYEGAISEERDKIYLTNKWVEIFKLENDSFIRIDEKKTKLILGMIFKRGYNINKLISKISDGKIGDFIRDVVANGIGYEEIEKCIFEMKSITPFRINKYLRDNLKLILELLDKRTADIHDKITLFNRQNEHVLQIEYSPNQKNVDSYMRNLLDKIKGQKHIANSYLTWNDIQAYIIEVINQMGFLEFVDCLINKQYKTIDNKVNIEKFEDINNVTFNDAEKEFKKLDKNLKKVIMDSLYNRIKDSSRLLMESVINYFEIADDFTLNFNINCRESIKTEQCLMKNIENLSLGQKVVAILTFMFNFGLHANDNTPLIIDQPEDNLDNQYIYKNLVKSLKKIKNSRQVILVTHSSTIVTNSDAEQVIVMNSDGNNGWVENVGYPSEKVIIQHIINHLEGGKDSFKHKMDTYGLFVKLD